MLSLSACKTISNKPVTQADYDRYFDNQIIEKNLILGNYSKGGDKFTPSDSPLKEDHELCLASAFKDSNLVFGTRSVSDPLSLLQFDADNKMEILEAMLSKKKVNSKFDAPDFSKNLKLIVKMNKARKRCLKSRGWSS